MAETAASRARRLLTLLPLLAEQGTVPLAALAAAAGTDEATVAADLTVLSLCGGDERDPGRLVGVYVEDDRAEVFAELPALDAPVRLTAPEARALVVALETIGVDPSSSLMERLRSRAGRELDEAGSESVVRSALTSGGQASVIAALSAAAEQGAVVRIRHVSSEGIEDDRSVHPYLVHSWRGSWYLSAWCETAGAGRTFRIDRIIAVHMTAERFERPEVMGSDASPLPDLDTLPRATIRFAEDAPDLTDRTWPGATFDRRADGTVIASVPYAGTTWIARAVTSRLGSAVVISPPEVEDAVAVMASALSAGLGREGDAHG